MALRPLRGDPTRRGQVREGIQEYPVITHLHALKGYLSFGSKFAGQSVSLSHVCLGIST